jgi:hypothetical protein
MLDQHRAKEEEIQTADLRQQELEAANMKAHGEQASRIEQARSAGTPPPGIGDKLYQKLINGDELTPLQAATAASAQDRQNRLQANQREKAYSLPIDPVNLHTPQNWQARLSTTDQEFQNDYGANMNDLAAGFQAGLRHKTQEELAAEFRAAGIADPINAANALRRDGSILNDDVEAYINEMTGGQGYRDIANGLAMINRLPSLETQQPEVAREINNTLDFVEDNMRRHNESLGDNALTQEQLNKRIKDMRADRYRVFYRTEYGSDPTKMMDEITSGLETRARTRYGAFGKTSGASPRRLVESKPDPTGPLASNPDLPGLERQAPPVADIPKSFGDTVSGSVDRYAESMPQTQVLNAIGDMGGREAWRGGKELLTADTATVYKNFEQGFFEDEAQRIKNLGGALARFATTGSFSQPRGLKDLAVSSTSKKPSVKPADVPQLDSFALAEEIRASKAARDAAGAKPKTHYRDRERRR